MSDIQPTTEQKRMNRRKLSSNLILFLILIGMTVIFSALSSDFRSLYNITSMLTNAAYTGIVAAALTFVLITGGLDISIGGNIALTSCVVAALYNLENAPHIAIIIILGLCVGAIIGSMNGLLITKLDLNPIITSLGTMAIASGLAYVITKSRSILIMEPVTGFISRTTLATIPMPLFWFIIIYVFLALLLAKTKFGRKVYCIGANQEAARLSGIKVNKVKYLLYLMSGITASFSGLIILGQSAVGMPQHGVGTELDVISAVLLGGTALTGGKGSILGTLAGVLILTILYNGFTMIGFKWVHIRVFQGILLVGVVALYEVRERKRY
jgi:ribose transport system permease protein